MYEDIKTRYSRLDCKYLWLLVVSLVVFLVALVVVLVVGVVYSL